MRDYWLRPNRAHDVIVVKIDPVQQGQIPSRMKVSCIYTSSNYLYNILKILIHCRHGTIVSPIEEREMHFLLEPR